MADTGDIFDSLLGELPKEDVEPTPKKKKKRKSKKSVSKDIDDLLGSSEAVKTRKKPVQKKSAKKAPRKRRTSTTKKPAKKGKTQWSNRAIAASDSVKTLIKRSKWGKRDFIFQLMASDRTYDLSVLFKIMTCDEVFDDANFEFHKDRMIVTAMDSAHVSVMLTTIPVKDFAFYESRGKDENLMSLIAIAKSLDECRKSAEGKTKALDKINKKGSREKDVSVGDDVFTCMRINKKGLVIETLRQHGKKFELEKEFTIKSKVSESETLHKPPNFLSLFTAELNAGIFSNAFKICKEFSNVIVNVRKGQIQVIAEKGEGDTASATSVINSDLYKCSMDPKLKKRLDEPAREGAEYDSHNFEITLSSRYVLAFLGRARAQIEKSIEKVSFSVMHMAQNKDYEIDEETGMIDIGAFNVNFSLNYGNALIEMFIAPKIEEDDEGY